MSHAKLDRTASKLQLHTKWFSCSRMIVWGSFFCLRVAHVSEAVPCHHPAAPFFGAHCKAPACIPQHHLCRQGISSYILFFWHNLLPPVNTSCIRLSSGAAADLPACTEASCGCWGLLQEGGRRNLRGAVQQLRAQGRAPSAAAVVEVVRACAHAGGPPFLEFMFLFSIFRKVFIFCFCLKKYQVHVRQCALYDSCSHDPESGMDIAVSLWNISVLVHLPACPAASSLMHSSASFAELPSLTPALPLCALLSTSV